MGNCFGSKKKQNQENVVLTTNDGAANYVKQDVKFDSIMAHSRYIPGASAPITDVRQEDKLGRYFIPGASSPSVIGNCSGSEDKKVGWGRDTIAATHGSIPLRRCAWSLLPWSECSDGHVRA